MGYNKPHKKSNDVRPSDYLCCISFRYINCSYWEIRVSDVDLYLSLQKLNTSYYLNQLNKTLYDVRQVA